MFGIRKGLRALRRRFGNAKRAKIGVSALIRLCIVSPRHVGSKPEAIRAALGK